MKIPYTNFSAKNSSIRQQLVSAFEQVMDSGRYIQGPEMYAFETEFASYCGAIHATGVANGTCGLHLVLRAMDIGAGDEVITAPNSFVASAASIALVGATPVFVDVADDLNIDPKNIEAAITPRTKAIIPVHLAGRPAIRGKFGLERIHLWSVNIATTVHHLLKSAHQLLADRGILGGKISVRYFHKQNPLVHYCIVSLVMSKSF